MNVPVQIPDGFKQDAKGRLIPESQIKPIDIERSDLVTALIEKAKEQQQQLCDFKALAFGDIAAFVQLSAEQYEVNLGGAKGNLTLFSFDGKYKVVRQCQDSIRFDERLPQTPHLIMFPRHYLRWA